MNAPKIVRLNAPALYALGMDRPTVEALINALRITGNDSVGVTVPELADKAGVSEEAIKEVKQNVLLIQLVTDGLEIAPIDASPSLSPDESWRISPSHVGQTILDRVEQIASEVRQVAEQVSVLMKTVQDDVAPRLSHASSTAEFLQTEVRSIADQLSVNFTQIQEIKQGTML